MSSEKLMVATGTIFLLAVLVGVYISQMPNITAEQFSAQVVEQNQRADVTSQLRATERGDLIELMDDVWYVIRANDRGYIVFSSCWADRQPQSIGELAKSTQVVIKQESHEWVYAARIFL